MKKRILVISKGIIHPSLECRHLLKKALNEYADKYDFRYSGTLKGIEKLKKEDNKYTAIILFYHESELAKDLLEILKEYVKNGGSIFAIHGALASFKTNNEYLEILGSKFTGHGDIGKITVSNEKMCFDVTDELYIHDHDPDNTVLLTGKYMGKDEPVMWTRNHGNGRVICFSLGHCPDTFKNMEVKKILFNALYFITNKEGTL